jgi:cation diffusion facilitator CzcD-associated flavoprotein CzcO
MPSRCTDVLVVGAGITGIYQLYRAREAGFSVQLLEAGTGVGGTWFWNRYPGARFDSESYTYGYLFSRELWDAWEWRERFADQPEIERYLNHVVDRFELRPHIQLGSRVISTLYNEAAASWTVTTDDGHEYNARFLIVATGTLSVPLFPDVPGRADFLGVQHHTGRWPGTSVDFTDNRVAVVGTGSSGVQIVPIIAEQAASLTVFQRSPNWCTPLNNAPITPEEQEWLRADFESIRETLDTSPAGFLHAPHDRGTWEDPPDGHREHYERMWNSPGFTKLTSNYTDLLFDMRANEQWCAFIADKIRSIVRDPETAAQLIPKNHRYGEHRPPFVTGYFEAFNRPNVSLVDLTKVPMVRVTESGIVTEGGAHDFDVIVWATGFDFGTGALLRMGVHGRGGVALTEHWADGPTTYLGVQTSGFPNLFFPGGPHAAAGNNPRYNGDQVDFITELLIHAREQGCQAIEVDSAAEDSWTAMIDRAANRPPSFGKSSFYFGTNVPGKPRRYLLNSAGRPKLLAMVAELRENGYKSFRFVRVADEASRTSQNRSQPGPFLLAEFSTES